MDLKSVLNESTATVKSPAGAQPSQSIHQPVRQHTYPPSHSSLHSSTVPHAPQPVPLPQPPPLRSPGSRSSSTSYDNAQSPSRHTSVSKFSVYGGSPDGPYSSAGPAPLSQPSYPVSGQHNGYEARPPASISALSSPSTAGGSNGPSYPSSRQLAPQLPHSSLPGIPLGPPATFAKPSPQTPHSTSAYDLSRTRIHSGGSLGSLHGHDSNDPSLSQPLQPASRDSLARRLSYDGERDKSMSVSPKTIPHSLPPLQQGSTEISLAQVTPPPHRRSSSSTTEPAHLVSSVEAGARVGLLSSSSLDKDRDRGSSPRSSRHQSPHAGIQFSSPPPRTAMPPCRGSPVVAPRQLMLKRPASSLTEGFSSSQPSRKRLKPAEIPIFARTARPNKPLLKLMTKGSGRPALHGKNVANGRAADNVRVNGSVPAEAFAPAPQGINDWEPSIMGSTPYEELTRYICDMIYTTIGTADAPPDGAVFEIEAKLGEIHSVEEGRRLSLPVMTETIFDKTHFGHPTRFESSINVEQHQALNSYLNNLCEESQQPSRTPIFYDHPRETDMFYSLTAAGEASLPPSIRKYLNPKHRPRVRVTTTPSSGTGGESVPIVKRRIIKSRIADFDVYCPPLAFDYRISISIESPYDGPDDVLVKINDVGAAAAKAGGDREKDRVSYRHLAYQIDLTQVSYPNSTQREHELEIEISTETIRQELANLREGRPSRYEDVVRGFLDNVRILARRGTLHMKR